MAKKKSKPFEDFSGGIIEKTVVKPKVETKPIIKEDVRLKVSVVRAYIFSKPDVQSRSLTAVAFGNLLNLIDEGDEKSSFLKVRVPRKDSSVEGFIQKTKVKRL